MEQFGDFKMLKGIGGILKDNKLWLSHDGSRIGFTDGYDFVPVGSSNPEDCSGICTIENKIKLLYLNNFRQEFSWKLNYYIATSCMELIKLDEYYRIHHENITNRVYGAISKEVQKADAACYSEFPRYAYSKLIYHVGHLFKPVAINLFSLRMYFVDFNISVEIKLKSGTCFDEVDKLNKGSGFFSTIDRRIQVVFQKIFDMLTGKKNDLIVETQSTYMAFEFL